MSQRQSKTRPTREPKQRDSRPWSRRRALLFSAVAVAAFVLAVLLWVHPFYRRVPADFPSLPEVPAERALLQNVLRDADRKARSDPGSAEKVARLGVAYHANLFFDQARSAYKIAQRCEPSNYRWFYFQARLEEEATRPDELVHLLETVVRMNPTHQFAAYKLGEALLKSNELTRAQEIFARLHGSDRSFLPAAAGLARIAAQEKNWPLVVKYLVPVTQAHSRWRQPYQMLAEAYEALGDGEKLAAVTSALAQGNLVSGRPVYDDFREELNELCRLATPLLKLASSAESSQDLEGMLRWSRKAVEAEPDDPDALHFLARALVVGRGGSPRAVSEALELRDRALRLRPDYPNPLLLLGRAFVEKNRLEEAVTTLQLVLDRYPESEEGHNTLGIALARQGKFKEAVPHYNAALRLNPRLSEAFNNLGLAYAEQGLFQEALSCYSNALRHEPAYADAHNNLGIALGELGRTTEAVHHFSKALQIDSRHFRARSNLGVILARQGRIDEAVEQFSEALRINPDFPPAREHLESLRQSRDRKTRP